MKLKFALSTLPHTAALISGAIPIVGVEPEFVVVTPIIAAFRRMVRDLEFDVCEMAPATYWIARSLGAPFVALPIFVHRQFHHDGIVCRLNSGIEKPKDLEGKRVGIRAYSVSTGVWKRGIMSNHFNLDCSKVTWVVDDEEAVPQLQLPSNVERAPAGTSLSSLFARQQLDAAFTGPAGIGRQGPPSATWNNTDTEIAGYNLFKESNSDAKSFYDRTGIYPYHGLIVVKESILATDPWVARSLYDAFLAAKQAVLEAVAAANLTHPEVARYHRLSTIVGQDPLPYGVKANRASIDALSCYVYQQGLTREPLSATTAFAQVE